MKLAMVYNKKDHKLLHDTYSCVYRGMFYAILNRFKEVSHIVKDCNQEEIDADVILFWDVNSCHHIRIEGIKKHPALKIEYWSDPHQSEVKGIYQKYNMYVHKLGAEQRVNRARLRGTQFVISPVKEAFYKYFSPHCDAERMLWYFPAAPCFDSIQTPILLRKHEVLANGAYWGGEDIGAYEFRKWAFQQPCVSFIEHCIKDEKIPSGYQYSELLKQYAGGLALCDSFPIVKYMEMPLAGMVVFAQYHREYEELGFRNFHSCIWVTKDNFQKRIADFIENMQQYQGIADAGRKLVERNYTAKHFADFVYERCVKTLGLQLNSDIRINSGTVSITGVA